MTTARLIQIAWTLPALTVIAARAAIADAFARVDRDGRSWS